MMTESFLLTGLTPGERFVSVECDGFAVLRASVEISAEDPSELTLQLQLPGVIEGVVIQNRWHACPRSLCA